MRVYVGFDDTDVLDGPCGTGKLTRRFEGSFPDGCTLWGVVRQQLLVDDRIPDTSHNSSACAVIDMADPSILPELISGAAQHIEQESSTGSDPGLCVAREDDPAMPGLMEIGRLCSMQVMTQRDVRQSGNGIHLSGHGGTNDGIIGAAAAASENTERPVIMQADRESKHGRVVAVMDMAKRAGLSRLVIATAQSLTTDRQDDVAGR